MRKVFLTCLSLLVFLAVTGQEKYWINSADQSPIDSLQIYPITCSDWLSMCSYRLTTDEAELLKLLGIQLNPVAQFHLTGEPSAEPTFALEQIESHAISNLGLTGKGVKIGIIDGGFLKANEAPYLEHFFRNNQVAFYKDYITPDMEPYAGVYRLDDAHGTEVWQMIGGVDPIKNVQFGMATGASYYLARTDHGAYEKRIEEDLLIKALEDMHTMGVRLVNISLGYNLGFLDPNENYTPEQMDGKTIPLTRAVEIASVEKGMLIVVAAGNDGADNWTIVSTPSDAEHALVVGAVKFDIWDKMDYSSIGADFVDYLKPDISVFSTQGTSFSAPVITGLAACIMEYDSTLTNFEIMELIRKSGNFYPYGNNYVGYGVPSCPRLVQLLKTPNKVKPAVEVIEVKDNKVKLSGSFLSGTIVAYHKQGQFVQFRNIWNPEKNAFKIQRPEGVDQTSVLAGKRVIEIFWRD